MVAVMLLSTQSVRHRCTMGSCIGACITLRSLCSYLCRNAAFKEPLERPDGALTISVLRFFSTHPAEFQWQNDVEKLEQVMNVGAGIT